MSMSLVHHAAAMFKHARTFVLSGTVAIGVLLGAAIPAAPAQAQMFQMMGGGPGTDGSISKRSIKLYGKILKFDQDQLDTMLTLHDGYASEHRGISEEMQGYMKRKQEEAMESQDWSVFQKEMPQKQREFAKRMMTAQETFLADVKGLCTPEQEERWPTLERHRKRETYLRFPVVAGVAVDVVDCLRRVGMAPEEGKTPPEVTEAVEQYELTLDRKLGEVERSVKDMEEKAMKMMENMDFQKIQEMMKKFSDEAILVRNINRDGARRVSSLLPDETRVKFDAEVQRRSFPRVYRKAYVTRAIDAAEKLPDLDGDQKTAIADIKAGYVRESGPLNDKWSAAITEREDKEGSSILGMMNWGGQQQDNPVSQARKARRDLDKSYQEKLMAVLKDDQKSKLPKEDSLPQGMNADQADMMGDFDINGGDEEAEDE
jgi:hypothetical protein